ncbi:DUF1266 domain-containing protein [Carnobacterium gallinarum]|uniref:DUF1266 domain-containing protein n=1 Tax=Carnobacterium gallinarum TaxID=2749 RepID=UPI000555A0C9|nr:DUF1266 domain-containing protein [Carnobacterium gallinarum]
MLLYIRLTRALKNSGAVTILGLILLFLGWTKDTYIKWNVEYTQYAIFGGGFLVLIGIYIFIRNFSGLLSTFENQQADFLFQHIAPEDKRKYLAVGALYSTHLYRTIECLDNFFLQKKENIDQGKKNIEEYWDIVDEQSAKKQLDWLLYRGHRNNYEVIDEVKFIFAQLQGQTAMTKELSILVKNIKKITYTCQKNNNEYIDETNIYKCSTISGWDYIRGVSVAKNCYNLGYLNEEEAWQYIISFGKNVKNEFSSWEELAISFLIGRYIWSEDCEQEEYVKKISDLFSFYDENEEDGFKENIWKKYSISEL